MDISVPVQRTVVLKLFTRLVRLVARVSYDQYTTRRDDQPISARTDDRGIAVVVLDSLTRRQWVREEDLAKDLRINAKLLRKILRHFEEQKLVKRHHRKEKNAKIYSGAVAATTDGRAEDKVKLQTYSYCCLDYQQIYDIVRCKLCRIKKKLKDEQEDKNTVQEYGCPKCQRKYNALDALRLLSMEDDSFHCEKCNGELVVECKKLTSKDVVNGDGYAKKLQMVEVLQDLMGQIHKVEDLPFPDYESYPEWEARAARAAHENGGLNPNDPSRSQGGYGSTSMQFLGETKVEVNLGEGKEDVKSEGGDSSQKVFPSWMIKEGMNLTDEQRGEMRHEANTDDGVSGGSVKISDESAMGNGDDKDLKDEYIKAYYAALLKQQEVAEKLNQQESAGVLTTPDIELASTTSSDRQVGMKSKREEEDEEDVEWEEEAPVAANGDYKVDLNVQADDEKEEEDDVEWEEG
ncbi:hypothetical protein EUTSA_v10025149mg [Eutrema salsugineum]|uniref:HTH TFE/IIEalpha-type domain-containing protein n=1 Tax=Eutrema salsugineum TaxID=72664 RepID=V4MQC7_EUTSA|nr:hypothetical protein EUTSA_v10025149mg [Eutrema salsugineum]